MSAKRWTIKLECGHWSIRLTPTQRDAALSVGLAKCDVPSCGAVSALTDVERLGGLTVSQTEKVKERRKEHRHYPVSSFPGGLLVRKLSEERCMWWCRWCHGKSSNRAKNLSSKCSLDDLPAEWAAHTTTGTHQRERSDRESTRKAVDAIFDNL